MKGTKPIAVKGTGLTLAGLYEKGARFLGDIDLLVPERSVKDWATAATRLGATWTPGRPDAYEAGYIRAGGALVEIHVALPGAAGARRGPTYEEVLARSEPSGPASGFEGVRTPGPGSAREIAVHHFVFHHAGEPALGLRVLQDLAALERAPEGPGLRWESPAPSAAVAWLRGVARATREARAGALGGDGAGDDALEFFHRLLALPEGAEVSPTFAYEVNRWLASEKDSGRSALQLAFRRLFPPLKELRLTDGEALWKTLGRATARPAHLAAKYGAGVVRQVRRPAEANLRRAWQRYLGAHRNPG